MGKREGSDLRCFWLTNYPKGFTRGYARTVQTGRLKGISDSLGRVDPFQAFKMKRNASERGDSSDSWEKLKLSENLSSLKLAFEYPLFW
jgi:hypothetical protein